MADSVYTCPCCGYPGLDTPPYKYLAGPPFPRGLRPPYAVHFGEPSYDVCACCGFEYGNDDDPGTAEPTSFEEYLAGWIAKGCEWFDPQKKPIDWSLDDQLSAAGISHPHGDA